MTEKTKLIISGSMGAMAVMLGAFGAHILKQQLTSNEIDTFNTGVTYHLIHSLVLLFLASKKRSPVIKSYNLSFVLILTGILFFSGSLYLLSIQNALNINLKWLGPITPIGGLLLILGWANFVLIGIKKNID